MFQFLYALITLFSWGTEGVFDKKSLEKHILPCYLLNTYRRKNLDSPYEKAHRLHMPVL